MALKSRRHFASLFVALLAITVDSIRLQGQSATTLVGVWRVAEIVSPSGEKNATPQPTIYIFSTRHYSHTSVTSTKPRPNYTGPSVTDAQRLEMWQPFTATAGTYDLGAREFTIRPMVSKNPGFMEPGSFTTFEITTEGKDIWIRATKADSGPIPPASANRVRLVRVE